MEEIIESHPFLTLEECQRYFKIVDDNFKEYGRFINEGWYNFGNPNYTNVGNYNDPVQIKRHNDFMKENFSDLLEKLINYFTEKYGQKVYLDDSIPYPGFHYILIPENGLDRINFHFDHDIEVAEQSFEGLKFTQRYQTTCTILLHLDEGCTAGLNYLPKKQYLKIKRLLDFNKLETGKNQKLKPLAKQLIKKAKLKIYQLGDINLQANACHNIYSKNDNDHRGKRVTFQGSLAPTDKGILFFW